MFAKLVCLEMMPAKWHDSASISEANSADSTTSAVGHEEKNSRRAYLVGLSPESGPRCGHQAMSQKCHVWTAPALQEENLTSERSVRVQPCIRPFDAAALAAGPDVIRCSGPTKSTRSFLAWHFTGFPIDGLDRFASTSSSPPAIRQFTNATSSSRCPVSRCRQMRCPVGSTLRQ